MKEGGDWSSLLLSTYFGIFVPVVEWEVGLFALDWVELFRGREEVEGGMIEENLGEFNFKYNA